MAIPLIATSSLQLLSKPLYQRAKVCVMVKREDLLHPVIGGNKWRKLKYNLIDLQTKNYQSLLSFGGAFSNHIHTLAACSKLYGIKAKAVIRSHHIDLNNPTLKFARACGMKLIAVNKSEYQRRHEQDYIETLKLAHPNSYFIPEGGSSALAIKGVAEMAASLPPTDAVCAPVGSAGTLAGLVEGLPATTQIIGIAVLKGVEDLNQRMRNLSPKAKEQTNWTILDGFTEGGYAKFTAPLWEYCLSMQNSLPLEPIYSGKMMFALDKLITNDYFKVGTKIIAIHTGGLQGLSGLRYLGKI